METKAYDLSIAVLFVVALDKDAMPITWEDVTEIVRQGEQLPVEAFVTYSWGKEPPDGQTQAEYLQNCKREAELLAADELRKRQPPTELVL